jgi:hypothetical protein
MSNYEVWIHHGESVRQRTASVAEEDRMDGMLEAIQPDLETNSKDPSTPEVQKFFDMLRALEESLHEHTTVSVLAFVTRLTAIKSKFTFSNKCYKELLSLISNILTNNHKMLKKIYCLLSIWSTRRLMRAKITTCFSTKSTRMGRNA